VPEPSRLSSEVFPALWAEFGQATVCVPDKYFLAARDAADFCDWDLANACRNPFRGRRSKQEFVVLTTMEGKPNVNRLTGPADPRHRNERFFDFRPYA